MTLFPLPASFRLSLALTFAWFLCLSDECQAQRSRGLLFRQSQMVNTAGHSHPNQTGALIHQSHRQVHAFPPAPQAPEMKYQLDWRRDPAFNLGTPQYPKYFGGFHYSQYYNLGIPNGDSGFRGNGVYWTPW